ncbi:MAG: hypothetical protein IJS60_08800 [Abditibacteriota bacterium]|nr:hypothetical protein [Abditibacteriota bacterium]
MGSGKNSKTLNNQGGSAKMERITNTGVFVGRLQTDKKFNADYKKVYEADQNFIRNKNTENEMALDNARKRFLKKYDVADYILEKALGNEVLPK